MKFYDRLGTVPVEPLFEAVRARQAYLSDPVHAPFAPDTVVLLGARVSVEGLRLQTLAQASPCRCSDPTCQMAMTHVAIERSWHGPDRPLGEHHANVYGRHANGMEVLFTHDHTLARSLGGEDTLANTTAMCWPCNSRKSRVEQRLLRAQRLAAGLHPHTGQRLEEVAGLAGDAPRVLKAQAQMAEVAQAHGVGVVAYRARCEAEAMNLERRPEEPAWTTDARLASALGISQAALVVFKQDKRAFHLARWQATNPPDALMSHLQRQATEHGVSVEAFRAQLESTVRAPRVKPATVKHQAQAQRLGLSVEALDAFRQTHPRRRPRP